MISTLPARFPIPVRQSRSRLGFSSPSGFSFPSGSAVNPIWYREARLPTQPDLPSLPAFGSISSSRLRIMVPGLLLLRRLAVPRTSWNQLHSAPNLDLRQSGAKLLQLQGDRIVTRAILEFWERRNSFHATENRPARPQRHTLGGTWRAKWNPS